jgi:hypothetical protein
MHIVWEQEKAEKVMTDGKQEKLNIKPSARSTLNRHAL